MAGCPARPSRRSGSTTCRSTTAPARRCLNPGLILYAKAQLAQDLDVRLRRFAKADPKFPNYSTAHLFLTDDQYENLVELGSAAGKRVAEMLRERTPGETPPSADQGIVFDAKDEIVAIVPPVSAN